MSSRHPRLIRAAPVAAFILFVAVAFWPLLAGQALYWGDQFLYFLPQQQFIGESLRSGRIPLWNPYVYCGQPLVGNPQVSLFYPTTLLALALPAWAAISAGTLAHLVLAGIGAYLYLRRLVADRTAAALGAVTYAGSGYLAARLQFPPMVQAAAWLPFLLLLVDRLVERPRIWYGALLALVVALSVLAGHAQITYMSLLCATLYALVRLYQVRVQRERARRALIAMAGSLTLGAAAASALLLPATQLVVVSTRHRLSWKETNRFVMLPEQILNFVSPGFFGNPQNGNYWGQGNFWEPCAYIGLVPLGLAVYAVARAARRPAVRFYGLLGAVTLWLALGQYGGIYRAAYYLLPGAASFHDPARFLFLTTFSLSALAAIGLRSLGDSGWSPRWRAALAIAGAADLALFSASVNPTLPPSASDYRPRALAQAPAAGQGRTFSILRDTVWSRYVSYSDYGPESARYAHELADTMSPNVGMRFGVEEAGGYEPVPIRAMFDLDEQVQRAALRKSDALHGLMRLTNTHALILPESVPYSHPGLAPRRVRGVNLQEPVSPGPRAWIVRRTRRVEGSLRSLAAVMDPQFDPSREAIVWGSGGLPEPIAQVLPDEAGPVAINEEGPHRASLSVDSGPSDSFLVWSSAWFPGWTATLDGKPATVERANHAFIGLRVPAGSHHVRFTYRPQAVQCGLYVSLASAGILAGLFAYSLKIKPGASGTRAATEENRLVQRIA